MPSTQSIQTVLIYALPVLFAITVHEAAHGYAARHFGDDTAYRLGRITLNTLVTPLENDHVRFSWLVSVAVLLSGWLGISKQKENSKMLAFSIASQQNISS